MGRNRKQHRRPTPGAAATAPLPFVSVITPTYNRRAFIPQAVRCFLAQTYPRDRMEWIVVDDGEDEVRDLFEGVPCVNYVRLESRLPLGKKRNFTHTLARGEILVYFDDDDYYPPERIMHAVTALAAAPKGTLVAGTSEIYVWFLATDEIYQFGPYHKRHCTAGTFAFRRELLRTRHYQDDATFAEEKAFLKDFTLPVVQLDPLKTMLVIAHDSNTVDKAQILSRVKAAAAAEEEQQQQQQQRRGGNSSGSLTMGRTARQSFKKPRMWIKDAEALRFYAEVARKMAPGAGASAGASASAGAGAGAGGK